MATNVCDMQHARTYLIASGPPPPRDKCPRAQSSESHMDVSGSGPPLIGSQGRTASARVPFPLVFTSTMSPMPSGSSRSAKHMKNALAMVICTAIFSSQLVAQPSVDKPPQPAKQKISLLECQKQYRDAEANAGLTHQAGTMEEICLNVGETCASAPPPSSDCVRARSSLAGIIARSISDRRPVRQ